MKKNRSVGEGRDSHCYWAKAGAVGRLPVEEHMFSVKPKDGVRHPEKAF